MDNKEAIERLLYMKHNVLANSPDDAALDMAIEALSDTDYTGVWEEKIVRGSISLCCSACGRDLGSICPADFCPNCGSEMQSKIKELDKNDD